MQQFVRPYFRPVWDLLESRGTLIFDVDTDGNINAILDDLIDCGINHTHPMEPAAGMDIVATRKRYGKRLSFNGGIDKFAVIKSRAAIDAELEYKLQPAMRDGGGIAFGLDHRIPNGTSLERYRYYVNTARRMLGIAPRDGVHTGWARMAM
jgi:uroporphyrinogen-III decarboxylase